MNPITFDKGRASWTSREGDKYHVTGTDVRGKRFKIVTSSWQHANGINLYRGSVWLVRDGKRYKIRSVFN